MDVKIQLDVKKEGSSAYRERFRYDSLADPNDEFNGFNSLNPSRGGSYKVSFLTFKTAFDPTNDEIESEVFQRFEENLDIVKNRVRAFTSAEFDNTSQDEVIDRKSVGEGKIVSVRVDLGGRRSINTKKELRGRSK